jgi:hypothetical protein
MSNKKIPSFLPNFSKRDVFAHMNNKINYLTRLKDVTDGFKAKQTLIDARVRNIENQNMLNYQGEHNRIIYALNHVALPGLTREMFKRRRNRFQELGFGAVKGNPKE